MKVDTVVCGDCLDVMREMPDWCVDAVITDPPYLVTDLSFDQDISMDWINVLLRIVKPNGYLCAFGLEKIQALVGERWSRRFSGIWLKEKGGMRTHNAKMPMCQQEPFVVYAHPRHKVSELVWNVVYRAGIPYKKIKRNLGCKRQWEDQIDRADSSAWTEDGYTTINYGTRQVTDVLLGNSKGCMKNGERTEHPTQKPLSVIEVQVEWLTNLGDLVFDPFVGSGTTAVAALKLGRHFYGCDINQDYVDIANERIEKAKLEMAQMELPNLTI